MNVFQPTKKKNKYVFLLSWEAAVTPSIILLLTNSGRKVSEAKTYFLFRHKGLKVNWTRFEREAVVIPEMYYCHKIANTTKYNIDQIS